MEEEASKQVTAQTTREDHVENDQDVENGAVRPASRNKKPAAGFTRTLIAKSENGAHSLAQRTERLHIEGADVLQVDEDVQV